MKKLKKLYVLTMMIVTMLSMSFVSCGDDKDDDAVSIPSGIIGTWSGSTTTKTGSVREIIVTFRSDQSGSFRYSSSVYFRAAEFTYTVSGSTISCSGVIVGEDGVVNDFNQQFEYHTSYMMPIGAYDDIRLTK